MGLKTLVVAYFKVLILCLFRSYENDEKSQQGWVNWTRCEPDTFQIQVYSTGHIKLLSLTSQSTPCNRPLRPRGRVDV
jgi:hypothetical protein